MSAGNFHLLAVERAAGGFVRMVLPRCRGGVTLRGLDAEGQPVKALQRGV